MMIKREGTSVLDQLVKSVRYNQSLEGKLLDDYCKIITIDKSSKTIVLDDSFGTRQYDFVDITAVSIIE